MAQKQQGVADAMIEARNTITLSLTDGVSPSKSVRLNHMISGIYLFEAGGK